MNSVEWCSSSLTNNGLTNQNTVPRDRSNLVQLDNENSNEDDGIDFIRKRNIPFQEREEVDNEYQKMVHSFLERIRCEDNHNLFDHPMFEQTFGGDGPRGDGPRGDGPRRPITISNPFLKRKRCEDDDKELKDGEKKFWGGGPRRPIKISNEQLSFNPLLIHFKGRIEDDDSDDDMDEEYGPGTRDEFLGGSPTYTLSSGEKVDVPIDWFGRIKDTSLNSIVEDGVWIINQELVCDTSFINDCWRILIDKFIINYRLNINMISLRNLCFNVKYDENFQINHAVDKLIGCIRRFNNGETWREIL